MNALSDSESNDSDCGRRFKTESTRTPRDKVCSKSQSHNDNLSSSSAHKRSRHHRSKSRSKSPSRNRSRSREYYSRKRSKSRERSHRKYDKYENEKSSRRHDSGENKQNERDKEKDKDRERERERERSSYHNSSSKNSEKHRSSSSHKRSHSKLSSSDEKAANSRAKSPSNHTTADTSEKHKKHKKDKDRDKDKEKEKHRDERSIKSADHEHKHEHKHEHNNEKPPKVVDSVQKRNIENIKKSPESNGSVHRDRSCEKVSKESTGETLICGPSLPPHMIEPKSITSAVKKSYGPSLPSDFAVNTDCSYSEPRNDLAGEEISESDDDDAGLIGPVLDHISSKSEAHLKLEKRALELKLAKLNECEKKDVGTVREEWMTELPELRKVADLGLTARQFRTKERDEIKDRSSWTETPRDREEKKKRKDSSSHDDVIKMRHQKTEKLYRERRDAEQEEAARKHKKKHKRDESLLEMHQKKLKAKTKEKSESTAERRPFSRDTDLQVNRFDEAQKKSILKKAQLLDTRFGSGQSKYL